METKEARPWEEIPPISNPDRRVPQSPRPKDPGLFCLKSPAGT
jgi:hypothetical protein